MSKDWDKYDDWGSVLEDSDAAQRFRAPKKKPTPGEQLADQGGFLPDPELEDLSNPVDYFAMAMDPEMRRIYDQDTQENIDFDEAIRAGELLEGVKIRKNKRYSPGVPPGENPALEMITDAWDVGKQFLPDPTSFIDMQEILLDMKAGATAAKQAASATGRPIIGGGIGFVGGVGLRRLSNTGARKLWNSVRSRFNHELLDEFGEIINPIVNLGDGTLARKLNINALEDTVFSGQQVSKMTGSSDSVGKFSPQPKEIGYAFVPPTQTEIGKVTTKLFNQHVLSGPNRVFDYNAFRSILDSDRARSIAILLESTPHTKIPNWKTHRDGLVDVFESIYGDAMQVLGIPRKQVQIDHLVTLRSSMPLYDGVAFGSPLWNNIQETLLRTKNKYQPGNSLANLNALDPGSHVIKTNFFNNTLGKNGELFFTPDKLEFMKKSDANRMQVLNDFIKIQDKGTQILHEAQKVWETIYKPGAKLPIDIVNELSKIPITKYSHPELRNLPKLRKLIEHIVKEDADEIIKNINRGEDLLINRINNPNLKIRVNNRKKNILPTPRQVQTKIQEGSKPYQPTLDPEGGMFIK